MKKNLLLLLLLPMLVQAQKQPEVSIAITNHHTAYPFNSFSKLFSGPFHPGMEVGYRFNWKTKARHDWYQTVTAGYFYHRFLQHALTLNTHGGYRYKLTKHWHFSGTLGLGYLHAIPETAVLSLNNDGEYLNAKGIGRAQALFNFSVGTQYRTNISKKSVSFFMDYRQMIQAPFVKSYVPLLPYNGIAIGSSISIHKNASL